MDEFRNLVKHELKTTECCKIYYLSVNKGFELQTSSEIEANVTSEMACFQYVEDFMNNK